MRELLINLCKACNDGKSTANFIHRFLKLGFPMIVFSPQSSLLCTQNLLPLKKLKSCLMKCLKELFISGIQILDLILNKNKGKNFSSFQKHDI